MMIPLSMAFCRRRSEVSSLAAGLPCQPHIRRDMIPTTVPHSGRESFEGTAPLCEDGAEAPRQTQRFAEMGDRTFPEVLKTWQRWIGSLANFTDGFPTRRCHRCADPCRKSNVFDWRMVGELWRGIEHRPLNRLSRYALCAQTFMVFGNARCACSCSVIAFAASTWRNEFRDSRSAFVIGLGGSNSSGVFVISSPSARVRPAGGWPRTRLHETDHSKSAAGSGWPPVRGG